MDQRFCWYDLFTTDLDAALAFYGDVVGLAIEPTAQTDPPYLTLLAGGQGIGGAMAITQEMAAGGARPGWLGYVRVEDIDAALPRLESLGGAVHRGKMEIPGVGWFAMVSDPQGAAFQLFQNAPGYPVQPDPPAGTPGKIGWRELLAGDWQAVWPFYEAMFGWKQNEAVDLGPMGTYQLWRAYGNDPDGGMFTKPPHIPRPMWLYYFVVHGAQAAADRIQAGGGQVLMGPMEVPGGGWVVNAVDPQGAPFAVLSGTP